jgi:hypothetical protein
VDQPTSDKKIVAKWQERIDTDFPCGAVVVVPGTYSEEYGCPYTYRTTGMAIVGVDDGHPIMRFYEADWAGKDFVIAILRYVKVQDAPLVVDVDGAEGYYRKLRFGGGFHSMGDLLMAKPEYERADLLALGW